MDRPNPNSSDTYWKTKFCDHTVKVTSSHVLGSPSHMLHREDKMFAEEKRERRSCSVFIMTSAAILGEHSGQQAHMHSVFIGNLSGAGGDKAMKEERAKK